MSPICFEILMTHRCCVGGEVVEPGQVLTLPADQVQAMIGSGRAALVNAEDLQALRHALAANYQRQVATVTPLFGQSVEGAEAQRRDFEQAQRPRNPIGFIWGPLATPAV